MTLQRRAKKRDENEGEIVSYLRGYGFSVYPIDVPCDLLVGFRGTNYLVEIKNGPKAKLTPPQATFAAGWRGSPLVVLDSFDSAREWAKKVRVAG